MKEKVQLMGEKKYEEEDFCNPKFYVDFFGKCLDRLEEEKTDDTQWLTTVLLGAQIMRTQIGDSFDQNFKEEVDAFLNFSLNDRFGDNDVTKEDIDLSRDFVQQTVNKLDGF